PGNLSSGTEDPSAPGRRLGGVSRRERRVDPERNCGIVVRARRGRIMNATERTALLQSVELFDELSSSIDERTIEILDHRRRTAIVRRRGWLVRRMLLVADILGLAGAFLLAELVAAVASPGPDRITTSAEFVLFLLTLPGWVVVAKLYGLYERDEARPEHSPTDR